MEHEITTAIFQVGTELTAYAAKGTVSTIRKKIQAIKVEKENEKIRNQYDEIISELIEEREDIIRIAQIYRSELEKVEISDKDIESLHNTIEKAIDIISQFSNDNSLDMFKPLKDLISVDTLKTMQLLGFNYKDAIGAPLTRLCANAIENIGKKKTDNNKLDCEEVSV